MHPAGAVRGHAARCLLLHPFFLRRRLIFSLLALATHVDITHVTTHPVQQADSCKLSPWSLVVFSLLPFAVGSRSKRTAAARPARSVLAPPHPSQQAARERKSKGAGAEREEKSPKVLGWYFSVAIRRSLVAGWYSGETHLSKWLISKRLLNESGAPPHGDFL
jgi:hypothetical protein